MALKQFKFKHTALPTAEDKRYFENELPAWLLHKDYKWFLEAYVLTLEIGAFVETDFHKITRVA